MNRRKITRLAIAVAVGLLLVVGAVACLPQPEPKAVERGSLLCASEEGNCVEAWNATDIVIYSDAGSTQKALIDGTDGSLNAAADYTNATANTTLTAAQTGRWVSNDGASGTITFTLPSAATGLQYGFYVDETQSLQIDPATGDQILHLTNSAGDMITNATAGDSIYLVAISSAGWIPLQETGTWNDGD